MEIYLSRVDAIDRHGPALNAVIEINPDAMAIADRMDAERKAKGPRGPWHGIPVLSKDNIETAEVTRRGKRARPRVGDLRVLRQRASLRLDLCRSGNVALKDCATVRPPIQALCRAVVRRAFRIPP